MTFYRRLDLGKKEGVLSQKTRKIWIPSVVENSFSHWFIFMLFLDTFILKYTCAIRGTFHYTHIPISVQKKQRGNQMADSKAFGRSFKSSKIILIISRDLIYTYPFGICFWKAYTTRGYQAILAPKRQWPVHTFFHPRSFSFRRQAEGQGSLAGGRQVTLS